MKNQVYFSNKTHRLKGLKPLEFEYNPTVEWNVLNIYPDLKFQKIQGFGGAFTSSSAENFGKMSDKTKEEFINLMFNKEKGLGYNFCRCTINSCDFSEKEYSYTKENDASLETFDISHDEQNIIPMIKSATEVSGELFLFASPWSPPAWMKDTGSMYEGGRLLKQYYPVWAEYFVKFIQEYAKKGVKISGITVQNEPMAAQTWESCIYTIEEQILFVRDFLKPAFVKAGLKDVKIMIWDHNKEHLYDCAKAVESIEGAKECVDGIAFHWYSGEHFDNIRFAHETSPELFLAASEFCFGGVNPDWRNALKYAYDMSGNFNNYMQASCDWNMVLDEKGGPYHARGSGCKAVIHYDTSSDSLKVMPHYYAVKHFSAFLENGAVRLGTSTFSNKISISAFLNPDDTVVAVIVSNESRIKNCSLRFGNYSAKISIKPKSIMTITIEK